MEIVEQPGVRAKAASMGDRPDSANIKWWEDLKSKIRRQTETNPDELWDSMKL